MMLSSKENDEVEKKHLKNVLDKIRNVSYLSSSYIISGLLFSCENIKDKLVEKRILITMFRRDKHLMQITNQIYCVC